MLSDLVSSSSPTYLAGRVLLSVFFTFAGITHFTSPKPFERIVPSFVASTRASRLFVVYVSGVAEIAGGLGLLLPFVQVPPAIVPEGVMDLYARYFNKSASSLSPSQPETLSVASAAAVGLLALLIAVFPANIHMAVNKVQMNPKKPIPTWGLYLRLPLQFVMLWAVYQYS